MKKILLATAFLLLFLGKINAQLGNISITSLPCMCAPGETNPATASPVSGATYYLWETMVGSINNVLFDGYIGPYQSALPSVFLTCVLPNPYTVICVTAHNATDSSNTACDTLWGSIGTPVFAATNSPTGIPGTSGIYAVEPPDSGCSSLYVWFLTGDVTFDGGIQTIISSGVNVNVNFGPGFTSGVLCVQGVTSFGIQTDTICMIINAPVGIDETSGSSISCYYQPSLNQVTLEFADAPGSQVAIKIFDITGRLIHTQESNPDPGKAKLVIPMPGLNKGVYFVEVTGSDFQKTFKFAKAD